MAMIFKRFGRLDTGTLNTEPSLLHYDRYNKT
jgi:hypothetical protein